jgi:hypothetical protein
MLFYRLGSENQIQIDQGDETEGLKMEGFEGKVLKRGDWRVRV